ncbi:Asp23/Gls24 family envelope stress response protein [Puniceicoccaceae bacterium K14]|nr:Asp23/Gls24 family envelope stress response protein [Puniceicoccaceae bacterium K14]
MTTEQNESTIESGEEHSASLGQIKVNHTVVAAIVKMAAASVEGVLAVGGGFVENVTAIFKDSDKGVKVSEDDAGNYLIEIRVIMEYGVELAKTAESVQMMVANQVSKMTGKPASSVDIIIEGVKNKEEHRKESERNQDKEES